MHTWQIFYENADTDDERTPLRTLDAPTMGEALQKASEYYECNSADLVAVQITKNVLFNPSRKEG